MSELGKILADRSPRCQPRAAVAESDVAGEPTPVAAAHPARRCGNPEIAAAALSHIVLIGGARYIREATQAAEISPNFRPQIGHIGR